MGSRKVRMCRLCLSTTAVLRSLFTIFRNHNLVFIIRDYVRMEVKEDDRLPKLVCKSCAVKLIRVRENVTLFIDSDRKLREKLGNDTELPDVVDELRQDKKRKYTRRADDDYDDDDEEEEVDGEDEASTSDKNESPIKKEEPEMENATDKTLSKLNNSGKHLFEFNEVKEEILDSDAEEDLPLRILKRSVHHAEVTKTSPNDLLADDMKDEPTATQVSEECKQETDEDVPLNPTVLLSKLESEDEDNKSDLDDVGVASPFHTDNDSDYEVPKAKRTRARRVKKEKEKNVVKTARTKRGRKKKFEIESEVEDDYDDEDKDNTFKLEKEDLKEDDFGSDSDASQDELVREVSKKKKRGRAKASVKPTKKRKLGTKKAVVEKSEPVPTLHDYKCYICNSESLGSRKAMIEHFSTHVDRVPHTCQECVMETVTLTRVRTLNTHMKMHAQPVKCDYCDRRYSNAAGKYYHTQTFHLGGGAPCLVNCEVCGKTCGSQMALKQHMKYHTTKLKCGKCDMVFNHPNKRRNHERIHDENRGYECLVCKKVLQTIESYDVHLKKHSQERSYQCHLCPKKFNTSCNLILHLKVHAKNDNYKPAKSWIEHYTVLNRNPMHFKCNHCDRYNTDKVNNMISHLQAHFKEYECDQCHHKFATAKQLRAHYTTHTGEKPEKCKYCDKVFSTKNNLRIHLKATHPEWVPQRQQLPATQTVAVAQPQPSSTPNSEIFESSPVGTTFGMMNISQHATIQQQSQAQHQVQTLSVLRS